MARIIEDGSTIQIGLGRVPNEMLKYLTNRKNLGIHSDVITEDGKVSRIRPLLHEGEGCTMMFDNGS